MNRIGICLILTAIIACFSSCIKKPEAEASISYSFANLTKSRVTLDVYGSEDDYTLAQNRLQQHSIEPDAIDKLSLQPLKTYWIDWYNEDLSTNNWRSETDGTLPPVKITAASEEDHFNITTGIQDISRATILKNGGLFSRWQTVVSDTGLLNGSYRFEFRKDFKGTYSFIDRNGNLTTTPISYIVHNSSAYPQPPDYKSSFGITIYDNKPGSFCNLYCIPFDAVYSGRDSMKMVLTRQQSSYYYAVVRQ